MAGITDVPGILVGHAADEQALTGCTVVICKTGAVGGVDQRGGAPGTRETDPLRPMHLVQKAHAIVLSGGSAFGLDAAGGVVRYLEEQGVGFETGVARVPIVPAAILFDLGIGSALRRPDPAMGYAACQAASARNAEEGNVGAGMGATAGKMLGMGGAMKTGLGTTSIDLGGGLIVGALVVANPFGDIVDPADGAILAGTRPAKVGPLQFGGEGPFADTLALMKSFAGREALRFGSRGNTVIGVVATNARLNKEETNKVAQMAQDGLARVIRPAHTMLDGDTIFALATGKKKADVSLVGAYAALAVEQAILRAARTAHSAGGLPSAMDYPPPVVGK